MTTPKSFSVWCLSLGEEEELARDVVAYDLVAGELPRDRAGVVYVSDLVLHGAADAAEACADYVHNQEDGYECSWSMTFRVRAPDGSISDFEVYREHVVEFHAAPVKAAPAMQDVVDDVTRDL